MIKSLSQKLVLQATRIREARDTSCSVIPYHMEDTNLDFTYSMKLKALIDEEAKAKISKNIEMVIFHYLY